MLDGDGALSGRVGDAPVTIEDGHIFNAQMDLEHMPEMRARANSGT